MLRPEIFRRITQALGARDVLPIDPDLDPSDPGEPSREHRRTEIPLHRAHPGVLMAIAGGGFLGTLGRYGVSQAWETPAGHFPLALFTINTSGAFLIGLCLTWLLERFRPSLYLRPFVITGVLGGWTTMSTFAAGIDTITQSGRIALALGYLTATLLAGLTAVMLGMAVGRLGATRSGEAEATG